MNIFSQTKLLKSLKLKKNTGSSSMETTSQNATVNNVKTSDDAQPSPNNSVASETDSFVEVMYSTQTKEEKLSQTIFKNSNKNPLSHSVVTETLKKQCPLCSQFIDEKNFINHVKLCGTTNNISSDLIIKAVELQERQDAERKALGLPSLITKKPDSKKKPSNKRQTKMKVENDANLNLAIAMSLSLQESNIAQLQEESEILFSAGLEKEALEKQKTLEGFGFMTNHPVKGKLKNNMYNTKLFQESKEDRERRITEKVAIILLDSENNQVPTIILNEHNNIKTTHSIYLKKIRNKENLLWEMSSLQNEAISEYYVPVLSKFIIPNINNVRSSLKKITQTINSDQILLNSEFSRKENNTTIKPQAYSNVSKSNLLDELSYKWKSMVDNKFMSDITIYTKDEKEISAHFLVLHVQCPSILEDIILDPTLSNKGKTKKIIMWLEYEYEACFAFLELVYSGKAPLNITKYSKDYLNLGKRYDVLMEMSNEEEVGDIICSSENSYKRKSSDFNEMGDCKRFKASSPDMFASDDVQNPSSSSPNFLDWWLKNCDKTQQSDYSSSVNNDFPNENSPKNIHVEKSPCHSFHSASTADIDLDTEQLNTIENQDGDSIELFSNNLNKKSENEKIEVPKNIIISPNVITVDSDTENSIASLSTNVLPKATNSHKEFNLSIPCHSLSSYQLNESKFNNLNNIEEHELKGINRSQSVLIDDDDSLDSILSCNTNILSQNRKKNQISPHKKLFNSSKNAENKLFEMNSLITKKKSTSIISDFELIDVSSNDSVYSDSTNILPKSSTLKLLSNSSQSKEMSSNHVLSSSNKSVICDLDDSNSICSMITNIIPKQNSPSNNTNTSFENLASSNLSKQIADITQKPLSSNILKEKNVSNVLISVIELDDDSSSDSNHSVVTNILPKNQSRVLTTPLCKEYENSFILTKSQDDNLCAMNMNDTSVISSATSTLSKSTFNEHDKFKKTVPLTPQNETNLLKNTCPNSLSNSQITEINNLDFDDSYNLSSMTRNVLPKVNTDSFTKIKSSDVLNISNWSPSESENKQNILCNQLVNLEKKEKISEITNKEVCEISNVIENEQIIDDPWMDYNDWQSLNFSPQRNIENGSINNSFAVEESEEKTPTKLITHNDISYSCNSKKKSALTPNKFGSKTSTPRTIRRIRSESTINDSKIQVTPMLDYSSMKTPDFMKELDRYGLKPNLGKRKGKQLLKYIYKELHQNLPSNIPSKEHNQIDSNDLCEDLDSTGSSETGIPEYLEDSSDEMETLSQAHSNKVPIELGFSQLLKADKSFHNKILCYEPIWIEVLKEDLKKHNVNVGMQKLMAFLDDKCITFRSKLLNDQRQKKLANKNQKRRKLF